MHTESESAIGNALHHTANGPEDIQVERNEWVPQLVRHNVKANNTADILLLVFSLGSLGSVNSNELVDSYDEGRQKGVSTLLQLVTWIGAMALETNDTADVIKLMFFPPPPVSCDP
jgi:hypothetical protein